MLAIVEHQAARKAENKRRILEALRAGSGSAPSQASLARVLDLTTTTVRALARELEQEGHLRRVRTGTVVALELTTGRAS